MKENKVIIYGAGENCKHMLSFLKYCNLDSLVYAVCDSSKEKVGSYIFDKPVLSFEESNDLHLQYVVTALENNKKDICKFLSEKHQQYYKDVFDWLRFELEFNPTDLNRDYCAFFHESMMDGYYDYAETEDCLRVFWGSSSVFLSMFNTLDLSSVIELACGKGRHVEQYADKAGQIVLVDILEKNIDFCKKRFMHRDNIKYYQNNGHDLSELHDEEYSALFTYDAMVHFELFDIYNYLLETYRVLKRGGKGLFHHSNLMTSYDQTFANPHNSGGRNFMCKELFAYLAYKAGFEIIDQKVIDWNSPQMDCITLVQKL